MKPLVRRSALPSLVGALERALSPDGACALDPSVPVAVWRRALVEPAAEFLARPGKGLRTSIVRAGWMLGGGAPAAMPDRVPLIVELLHAGSLIIDDVEDGSTERRGAPTLHRLVGVPLAINTGTWMYCWSLAELAALDLTAERELVAHRLAATTLVRCHEGQALDLATRIGDLAVHDVAPVVEATTRLKTGALCRFAAELGALAAGADDATRTAVGRFGETMGIGLQMLDDLGSLASPARRYKAHEDLLEGRPTWPWAWLAEQGPFAWSRYAALARALATAATPASAADELGEMLHAAVATTGRARIREMLDRALAELTSIVDGGPVTEMIAAELGRMEASYG